MIIEIEFCIKWRYDPEFDRVSKKIETILPNAIVNGNITHPRSGSFEVKINDRLVFSKLLTNQFPTDNDIISLSLDFYGGLLVGSDTNTNNNCWNRGDCGELARWDGNQWELLPTSIPGSNNDPYAFYDITSDADGIYAGTNRGACMWFWPTANEPDITLNECWNEQGGNNNDELSIPSRFVYGVSKIGIDTLYAGTDEGVAVINTNRWNAMQPPSRIIAILTKGLTILYRCNMT